MAAAKPLSAVEELEIQRLNSSKRIHLSFGCDIIDHTLKLGLESGVITCMSGDRGTGKTVLAMNLIANSLIKDQVSNATVIDTTGRFSVIKLYQTFLQHIQNTDGEASNLNVTAEHLMEKVRIVRAFDLTGVIEAVTEFKQQLLSNPRAAYSQTIKEKNPKIENQRGNLPEVIPDSEDEDDDILLDISPEDTAPEISNSDFAIPLLVIDEFPNSFSYLASRGMEAQVVFYSFLSALSKMTATYNMVTIILNPIDSNTEWLKTAKHPTQQPIPRGLYHGHFLGHHIFLYPNRKEFEGASNRSTTQAMNKSDSGIVFRVFQSKDTGMGGNSCIFNIDQGTRILTNI